MTAASILLTASLALAYEYPLNSRSVQDAYFLGQARDHRTSEFLKPYSRPLPLPKSGPHIAEIELRTPYAQAVLRAQTAPGSYSAQQAVEDYEKAPDSFVVRVKILLTPTYPAHSPVRTVIFVPPYESGGAVALRPDDFWREFAIRVSQDKELKPRKVTGTPIYNYSFGVVNPLVGAEVELEFDARRVKSEPLTVEVESPDGRITDARFDLTRLR